MKAQDQYEYATVTYSCITSGHPDSDVCTKYVISTSKEGKFEESNGLLAEGSPRKNLNPVLEIINKMSKKGWDIHSSNISMMDGFTQYYFLLKKKEN